MIFRRENKNLRAAFQDARQPKEQWMVAQKELEQFRLGNISSVFQAALDSLKVIDKRGLTLLDMGCGAGYYSEIINAQFGNKFKYTGADYSEAMVTLAKQLYPQTEFTVLDITNMQLPDKAFDVVFSGAVLVHLDDWKKALLELTRVCKTYLILHRTPLSEKKTHRKIGRIYADVKAIYNTFNSSELLGFVEQQGFRVVNTVDVYSSAPNHDIWQTITFTRK